MIDQSYDEWKKAPEVKKTIKCPQCGKRHKVKEPKSFDGVLQYYNCGGQMYLCGFKGKVIGK
jgi:ssDNA-binding Zn-finger/Zn-ribbon topoisomerase 1